MDSPPPRPRGAVTEGIRILAISLILFGPLNVFPGDAALMAAGAQEHGLAPQTIRQMR